MGRTREQTIKVIKGMGFTEDQAKNSLLIFNNDEQKAIDYLL
jgi:uncharacterized UBP type Zn finger protein